MKGIMAKIKELTETEKWMIDLWRNARSVESIADEYQRVFNEHITKGKVRQALLKAYKYPAGR